VFTLKEEAKAMWDQRRWCFCTFEKTKFKKNQKKKSERRIFSDDDDLKFECLKRNENFKEKRKKVLVENRKHLVWSTAHFIKLSALKVETYKNSFDSN
jgi:hypothetical protein